MTRIDIIPQYHMKVVFLENTKMRQKKRDDCILIAFFQHG